MLQMKMLRFKYVSYIVHSYTVIKGLESDEISILSSILKISVLCVCMLPGRLGER